MTPERWQRARHVFEGAIELPEGERRAFVAVECAGDALLRDEVESLLDVYERPGGFSLGAPVIPVALARSSRREEGASADDTLPLWRCAGCGTHYTSKTVVCPRDGRVVEFDREALVGRTLDGEYRIERVLGAGTMGTVYLATWESRSCLVSVKILASHLLASRQMVRRFEREARVMARIHHPGLVRVYDVRIGGGVIVYFVQEYVPGSSLRRVLNDVGPMGVGEVLEILRPIAGALDAAHGHGVVHRDVKPENILVSRSSSPFDAKLADLGVAKILKPSALFTSEITTLTVPGERFGTPYYMAPELWLADADSHSTDGRVDVYGLGAVAYEMLSGRRAVQGDTIEAVREAHLRGRVEPLRSVVPGLTYEIARIVDRALSRSPADRYSSPGEIVRAMAEAGE